MRTPLLLAATLALTAPLASAADPDLMFKGGSKALIAFKNDFKVEVVDRVTDGCLPQPQALRKTMESVLINSGFTITQGDPAPLSDKVIINVLGHKTGSGLCAIHIDAWLNHWLVVNVPYAKNVASGNQTYLSTRHSLGQQLFAVSATKTQERAEHAVTSLATILKDNITTARQYAEATFPEMATEFARFKQ